jgi:UDP-N-acetylglucosamine--N-acetylmuramyl-(pentapeptide) pyrophosphoryl-undecaprenol N-acetylglucosamine transferase
VVPNSSTRPASTSVVIGAGGTGGHIYPGLATADAIRAARPDARIVFVGTKRGLEGRLIPQAGYDLVTVDMLPFNKNLRWKLALFPVAVARSTVQSLRELRRRRADVVLGMGGYPSVPAVLAAWVARAPRIIHESNATPGLANRFVSRFVPNIALAFQAGGRNLPPHRDTRLIGMPISDALAGFDRAALRDEARAHFGIRNDERMVLVSGGSLGAVRLSQAAADLAGRWRDRTDVRVVIKAGRDQLPAIQELLAQNGGTQVATALAYLDRMDLAYAAADVTVCRAGSGTVAELSHVGLPAVLVPYPSAAHDHQSFNAQALVELGAAVMIRDAEVTADRLEQVLDPILADPDRLATMAAAAHQTVHGNAAHDLARWVLQLADGADATDRRPPATDRRPPATDRPPDHDENHEQELPA